MILEDLFDGAVLDSGADKCAAVGSQGEGRADRGVVRLGPAARENDFPRLRPDEGGYLLPGAIDCLARLASEAVAARGIAVVIAEPRQHRLEHLGSEASCGVVVEIDHERSTLTVNSLQSARRENAREPRRRERENRPRAFCLPVTAMRRPRQRGWSIPRSKANRRPLRRGRTASPPR